MIDTKIKQELNKRVLELPDYARLDKDIGVAWHPLSGLLVEEWEEQLIEYCNVRNRTYFFGLNEWGMPVCIFDNKNVKAWQDSQKKERLRQKKMTDRKWVNPDKEK